MGKVSQQWKELEKTAARKLGGERVERGNNFSQTLLDVEHPIWAIDAKWRSTLAVFRWYQKLVSDAQKLYGNKKIPILVIKEKGKRGELIVISLDDFLKVVKDEFLVKPEEETNE